MKIRLALLAQYRSMTDKQTNVHIYAMQYIASWGKKNYNFRTDFTDRNLYSIKGALALFVLFSFSGYVC